MGMRPNVVLVHGAWADGSSWSAVIERLQADGFTVTAPQFSLTSLSADVARLRHVLSRQSGPTVVVGHSYGGQVMTALGSNAPEAIALVYIAAFGLDEGESIGACSIRGHRPRPSRISTSTAKGWRGCRRGQLRHPFRSGRRTFARAGDARGAAAARRSRAR